jgi:hypothetical protein
MTGSHERTPPIAVEVPWSEHLTAYDCANLGTYLRVLDALDDGASTAEIARIIFDLDPQRDPDAARRIVDSHARRARWLTERPHLLERHSLPTCRIH